MIEEHVTKLAELQAELKGHEARANEASGEIDQAIEELHTDLSFLEEQRETARQPHAEAAEELKITIKDIYGTIIDEWTGEHKTMVFDAGTLEFTTRGSLKVIDDVNLFIELYGHLAIKNLVENYLKGFNLTAVEKYMSIHDLPIDVAEIEYTTTVKLEQKSGHHSHTLCRRHML